MNRRQFLSGAMIAPVATSITGLQFTLASLTTEFLVDNEVEVQMLLSAHATDESAEAWRRSWSGRAFQSFGEWYLGSTEERALPDRLASMPGDMHYYQFRWGEAGEHDSILAGTFRRNHLACVFRLWGDHETLLIEMADWLSTRPLPDPWEFILSSARLEAFVPSSESFGKPIDRHDDRFWF